MVVFLHRYYDPKFSGEIIEIIEIGRVNTML